MNVLSDILCNTSPLILSTSYNAPLLSHNSAIAEPISKKNLLTRDKNGHLLDSLAAVPNRVQVSNAPQMENGIFHHMSSSNVSGNVMHPSYAMHQESGHTEPFDVSVYQDDVPSWLANDLLKASENIPTGFLPDIYSPGPSSMLELGFSQEIPNHTSVDDTIGPCLPNRQALPHEFSTSESLLMSSFPDISSTNLSLGKTSQSGDKYGHNIFPSEESSNTTHSIINAILPLSEHCDLNSPNQLLSLSDHINETHLSTTGNQVMMTNTGNRSHQIDVMTAKLPQLSLNQLDLALNEMHMLPNTFSNVSNSEKLSCNNYPHDSGIGACNTNIGIMNCSEGTLSNLHITPFSQPQQIVDIARTLPQNMLTQVETNNLSDNIVESAISQPRQIVDIARTLPQNMLTQVETNNFSDNIVESAIIETHCFKCKFCMFLSLERLHIRTHIHEVHLKGSDQNSNVESTTTPFYNTETVFGSSSLLTDDLSLSDPTVQQRNSTCTSETNDMSLTASLPHVPNVESPTVLQRNLTCTSETNDISLTASLPHVPNVESLTVQQRNLTCTSEANDMSLTASLPHVPNVESERQYVCTKCNLNFNNLKSLEQHLTYVHNVKSNYVHLEPTRNKPSSDTNNKNCQPSEVMANTVSISASEGAADKSVGAIEVSNSGVFSSKDSQNRRNDKTAKKNSCKKSNSDVLKPTSSLRKISSHKEAWQKKIKRELGSYICEFKGCSFRFRALDNLEYHQKCHVSGSRKFACPECAASFNRWGPTAGHLWRHHSTDVELHACDLCSFRTHSLSNLENFHKPIHQNKCMFLCDTCGKEFRNGKQLRNHRARHAKKQRKEPPKKFSCFICSRQFLSKKFLRLHLDAVHNKQKLYLCKYCGYSASKSSTLDMHMRQHTGEKPFACEECGYRTSDHNSLRRHKMKHTGEKPYKCPFCTYASIQSSTFKSHLKNQHPNQSHDIVLSCFICSFKTLKQDNYSAHMAEHEMETASRAGNSATKPLMDNTRNSPDSEILPLVEAVDISLSHGDRSVLFSANKDIPFYIQNLNENSLAHL